MTFMTLCVNVIVAFLHVVCISSIVQLDCEELGWRWYKTPSLIFLTNREASDLKSDGYMLTVISKTKWRLEFNP